MPAHLQYPGRSQGVLYSPVWLKLARQEASCQEYEDHTGGTARAGIGLKQSGEVAYTIPLTEERLARIELAIAKTGESKRSFFRDAVYEHLLRLEALE